MFVALSLLGTAVGVGLVTYGGYEVMNVVHEISKFIQ